MTSFTIKIPSVIFLPLMNAVWLFEIKLFKRDFNLLARTLSKSLKEQLMKLIGLKSPVDVAFDFFGMRTTKDELVPSGKKPVEWKSKFF